MVVAVTGGLAVTDNLAAFGQALRAFVQRIPAKPETDQQFADCDAACKTLKKAEDALAAAEEQALAQVSGIEQMRRTVADLKNIARTARLATEKLVKAEKDARRAAVVMQARQDWQACADELSAGLRGIVLDVLAPDFATAIKGLSSFESIQNKLGASLLEGKSQLQARAAQIGQALQVIDAVPAQFKALIPDWQALAKKDAQTLGLLIDERIRQHQQAQSAAPATATADAAPAQPESVADEASSLKLGDINTRLYPLHVTADILRQLGIEPAAKERAATLYRPSQWTAIKAALINHLTRLP